MPRYPGTLNGAPPQPPPRETQVTIPWPPGVMAESERPATNRGDVLQSLKGMRKTLLENKVPFDDYVWAVHKNPGGALRVYYFHADAVPTSSREPWVFRQLAVDPPDDSAWEVKFVQAVAAMDAPPPTETLQ